jgi:hypothetical protein
VLKSWKTWVLILLFLGPYFVYVALGFLWLFERGWIWASVAALVGFGAGVVGYVLAARWTKSTRSLLPPIDWNSPATFAPIDRQAWEIVQNEAEKGEAIGMEPLVGADLYIDTGRRLGARLAKHYHPLSEQPMDNVPVLELLTALELAAEDLNGLCRQVPGGDLITPGHWKTAVQAAGYITKANNIYSYLLPLFNPLTGLPRLASQHLMIKPAWKSMQENMLRWFYQAYVNRLGVHLIELYSGRLVIGAEQYRRLTRKMGQVSTEPPTETRPLTIAVAGARGTGHDGLVEAIREAKEGGDEAKVIRGRLMGSGISGPVLDKLLAADWVEVPGYTAKPDRESARDRSTRRHAVTAATDADLLLLLIDDRHGSLAADAAFAADWDRWYVEHPALERPPVVVAMVAADRSRLDAARAVLPPTIAEIVALDPAVVDIYSMAKEILPSVAAQLPRAERVSILRHLQRLGSRSKAGRLVRQVGETGKWLLTHLRRPRPGTAETPTHEPERTTKV